MYKVGSTIYNARYFRIRGRTEGCPQVIHGKPTAAEKPDLQPDISIRACYTLREYNVLRSEAPITKACVEEEAAADAGNGIYRSLSLKLAKIKPTWNSTLLFPMISQVTISNIRSISRKIHFPPPMNTSVLPNSTGKPSW
jgi:hypothetical protein